MNKQSNKMYRDDLKPGVHVIVRNPRKSKFSSKGEEAVIVSMTTEFAVRVRYLSNDKLDVVHLDRISVVSAGGLQTDNLACLDGDFSHDSLVDAYSFHDSDHHVPPVQYFQCERGSQEQRASPPTFERRYPERQRRQTDFYGSPVAH